MERARVCSHLYFGIWQVILTSDLACLGFCSLGYSAETECIVLVELLLKESVARFFPSLGFPRINSCVSCAWCGCDLDLISDLWLIFSLCNCLMMLLD